VAALHLAYVQALKDRHGHPRHYFRRPGCPRVTLPGHIGSPEFMAAYQAALAGEQAPKPTREQPGTFGALCAAYYASAEYKQLAKVTQVTYRNITERLRAEHGHKPVAMIETRHIKSMVAAKASTPAAANSTLKMLRILMAFAVPAGMRRTDPCAGVKRVKSKSDGFATWTEADIAVFEARWPLGTRQHLAMALLLYTGQRGRSDVARMGPQHVYDGKIAVRQSKTGTRLLIPLHQRLKDAIAASPCGATTFIAAENGKAYTSGSFGNWFADAVRDAGLAGLAAHGLRKAAARRMAEAGCTPHQIAAVTGHRSLREVEHYTRAADQAGAAEQAMAMVARASGVNPNGQGLQSGS
jgi:integrase